MKLTIIAATGATGRQVLEQAIAAGHDVRAAVRNPAKLTVRVPVVKVDLGNPDPAVLASAIVGSDAVLSALGATSRAEHGVATHGTQAVIAAMHATGARRLIVLSAAPIGTVPSPARPHPPRHDEGDGFLLRRASSIIRRVLRDHYADLATMEDAVRGSDLDWTIVRPPQLTDKPLTGTYRVSYGHNPRNGWKISRADVAHFMLRASKEPEAIGRIACIAN